MPGRQFSLSSYRFGYQGSEKDDNVTGIGQAHITTFYREGDTRLGRWWSRDPVIHASTGCYSLMNNNPISYNDIRGNVGSHKNKQYQVHVADDNTITYTFGKKNTPLEEMPKAFQESFNKEVDPVYRTMVTSTLGKQDIDFINKSPIVMDIALQAEETMKEANSELRIYSLMKDNRTPAFLEIRIKGGNYDEKVASGEYKTTTRNEWISSVMNVEIGHLSPEQIQLEASITTSDEAAAKMLVKGESEFQKAYTPLLQKAVDFRIKYRIENNLLLDKEVLAPIENNNNENGQPVKNPIPYSEYHKSVFPDLE